MHLSIIIYYIILVCIFIYMFFIFIFTFLSSGVQEALGRIASEAYILTSAQMLINSMLANHEQPAVLSAVMKYETTSRARNVVNDGIYFLPYHTIFIIRIKYYYYYYYYYLLSVQI